ncbi:putative ABC transport system substrate-binding protein [Methylobacterium sp. OAE515]
MRMRRRSVIAGLPLALAAWPLGARAQAQPAHVTALWPFAADDAEGLALSAAFHAALRDHGRGTLRVEDQWGGADRERTRLLAADLVAKEPQVIFTYLSAQLTAVSALTRKIPIVFVGASDPVGFGYVASLQRPGGNITGFTLYESSLGGKWLAALKEAVPTLRRVTLLANPSSEIRGNNFYADPFRSAATALGIEPDVVMVQRSTDIDPVIADLGRQGDAGLIVAPGTFSEANGDRIVALTADHRIPTVFAIRRFANRGGLMSYGPDTTEAVRRAAAYVDRILHGDNPATLPVQAPTKFDLVVNLKTARSLGLDVPSALLAQADEIVE